MSFSPDIFRKKAIEQQLPENEIQARLIYADKLLKQGLPVIFTTKHLALMIGIKHRRLWHIIQDTSKHYTYFRIQQKNNLRKAPREIMAPKAELKYIQKWIVTNILENIRLHPKCTAYRKGFSIVNHASEHQGKAHILMLDLSKFFDTITHKRVYGLFKKYGYNSGLAWDLAVLCTAIHRSTYWTRFDKPDQKLFEEIIFHNHPVLPQGSPASPYLSNILLKNLDKRLDMMARKSGFNYSRYADDLAFSSNNLANLPRASYLRKLIKEEGFFLNDNKTKL